MSDVRIFLTQNTTGSKDNRERDREEERGREQSAVMRLLSLSPRALSVVLIAFTGTSEVSWTHSTSKKTAVQYCREVSVFDIVGASNMPSPGQ